MWRSDQVQLINGDCLDVMPTLEPGSVDLILSDLPYGATACKWDSIIPLAPLWECYRRILKPKGAIVLTAIQPFTSLLVISNPKWFRYCLVWEKNSVTGFLDSKRKPLRSHEDICVFSPGRTTYNPQKWEGRRNHSHTPKDSPTNSVYRKRAEVTADTSGNKYPRSVISFPKHTSTERLHPCQKPVDLFEYLINTFTNEGELVLDNAIGSGTTAVACQNTGRRCIGIERAPEHFATAMNRVKTNTVNHADR